MESTGVSQLPEWTDEDSDALDAEIIAMYEKRFGPPKTKHPPECRRCRRVFRTRTTVGIKHQGKGFCPACHYYMKYTGTTAEEWDAL